MKLGLQPLKQRSTNSRTLDRMEHSILASALHSRLRLLPLRRHPLALTDVFNNLCHMDLLQMLDCLQTCMDFMNLNIKMQIPMHNNQDQPRRRTQHFPLEDQGHPTDKEENNKANHLRVDHQQDLGELLQADLRADLQAADLLAYLHLRHSMRRNDQQSKIAFGQHTQT